MAVHVGSGRGGRWRLAKRVTIAAPVAQVDVIDLVGASDILVIARDITLAGAATRQLLLSTDNGATFHATLGITSRALRLA